MRDIERMAIFSEDRRYRYLLMRKPRSPLMRPLGDKGSLLMVMLNPSRADARQDDPTTTFCMNRAFREGFTVYAAVNLFALVSTDPKGLLEADDPIGARADEYLGHAASMAQRIVVAWGSFVHPRFPDRAAQVLAYLKEDRPIHCFGLNAGGSPRFPRGLPKDVEYKYYDD